MSNLSNGYKLVYFAFVKAFKELEALAMVKDQKYLNLELLSKLFDMVPAELRNLVFSDAKISYLLYSYEFLVDVLLERINKPTATEVEANDIVHAINLVLEQPVDPGSEERINSIVQKLEELPIREYDGGIDAEEFDEFHEKLKKVVTEIFGDHEDHAVIVVDENGGYFAENESFLIKECANGFARFTDLYARVADVGKKVQETLVNVTRTIKNIMAPDLTKQSEFYDVRVREIFNNHLASVYASSITIENHANDVERRKGSLEINDYTMTEEKCAEFAKLLKMFDEIHEQWLTLRVPENPAIANLKFFTGPAEI